MPRQPGPARENRFSRRLNKLLEDHLAPTDPPRPWTLTEIAERTGLSVGYLSRARLGGIEFPGQDKLKALASFFGVHVDYFTQEREDAATEAALLSPDVLESLRKPDARALLLRAGHLGPAELRLVRDLMDYAERISERTRESHPEDHTQSD